MLIVISTSGQISVLLPELDLDPSRREAASNEFIENFALVQTYNVNSEISHQLPLICFQMMMLKIGMTFY